jgi:hypothetical protein
MWLDQWGAGNVLDTGNVTATGNVAWRRGTMTYSPIIGVAGTVPDPAGAPDSAGAPDPAGVTPDPAGVTPDPAGTAPALAGAVPDPARAVPDPAGAAPDPGTSPGQPAEPAASYAGFTADAAGSAADAADSAGSAAGSGSAADSGQQDEAGIAWPHQSFLALGALPTAAPCARLHTTLVLWEWHLDALAQTAGLVVSELVSNAVQASAGLTGSRFAGHWAPGTPPVRVWLSADDHRVVIQIWDGSDRPPVPQPVEPEADSGRGLLLVGSLSAEWGCYTPEKSSGKVVWAVVTG